MRASALTLLLALASAGACDAGDGSALDEQGRALEHPYAPGLASRFGAATFPPTFGGITDGFFASFCTSCHAGPSSPKGLDLSAGEAYAHLVGVPSVERPERLLVDPGDPDASYLVVKLEGSPGMAGRQMPRDRPARPAEEIDVIRLWIDEGAAEN